MATDHYPTGNRLAGKMALITGGARGMGASHARAMINQGAKVAITDLLDAEGEALAKEFGDNCVYFHHDVTDRTQWKDVVAKTVAALGGLNVLVNNAGIANFAPIGDYTYQQWDDILAINLTSCFNGITESLEALKASAPSSIISISSSAGIQGYSALPGYCAAKWGMRGLTKSVALDVAQFNIRANTIHPGAVVTPMTKPQWESPQEHVAMRRLGRDWEISNLVVFLASDESSFSTGVEFIADGGETVGLPPAGIDFTGYQSE
ncbi:MAG: SDR family oxidoreductase [Acidimicrobiia bacterium]